MRIVGGRLGGQVFEAPRGHRTHPMADRIRGALFNALGDIDGLEVLDAFAGSGAIAFEALSRGAARAVLIDQDRPAQDAIAAAMRQLKLTADAKLIRASTAAWLRTAEAATFDIVICDPPYDDLQLPLIERLGDVVTPDGLLVLSWPGKQALPELPGWEVIRHKQYGDAQLGFYTRLP